MKHFFQYFQDFQEYFKIFQLKILNIVWECPVIEELKNHVVCAMKKSLLEKIEVSKIMNMFVSSESVCWKEHYLIIWDIAKQTIIWPADLWPINQLCA